VQRSFASIGRLSRPFGLPASVAGARPPRGKTTARRARTTPERRRGAGSGALTGTARTGIGFIWAHAWLGAGRRARIALVGVLLALPVLGGGWLWLRSSPLVSVETVRLSGVHGPEAAAIESALTAAARQMSTLDVNHAALHAAVAPFPLVREVRAIPSPPHSLRIEVIEQPPVAALTVGAVRTAVAADGVVLGPALLSSSLPSLTSGPSLAGVSGPVTGKRVSNGELLSSLVVLGAAPAPLARLVSSVYGGPRGLTVTMRGGLLAYFGDAIRPHAKWLSLARVLADPSSAGASYVDVRLPERPAAGLPAGVTPSGTGASATTSGSELSAGGESTIAALAAGLTRAAGGGAATSSPTEAASSGATSSAAPAQTAVPTTAEQGAPTGAQESEAGATAGG
jgi:cell division protein FtsQ